MQIAIRVVADMVPIFSIYKITGRTAKQVSRPMTAKPDMHDTTTKTLKKCKQKWRYKRLMTNNDAMGL